MAEGEIAMAEGETAKAEGEISVEVGGEEASAPSDEEASAPSDEESMKDRCQDYAKNALLKSIACFVLIVFVPLYFLCAGVIWLLLNIDITHWWYGDGEDSQGLSPMHRKIREAKKKFRMVAVQIRLAIFTLLWIIVSLSYSGLRNKLVLGSNLWKWTLLVASILIGYPTINIISRVLIYLLCRDKWIYYVKGMRKGLNMMILSAFLLVTWASYFKSSHGIKVTDETETVLHVLTWSFVTFAVSTVLWVLKTAVLLKWEADAVYRRFRQRIIFFSPKTYFLGLICEWSFLNEENLNVKRGKNLLKNLEQSLNIRDTISKEKYKARKLLFNSMATLYDIRNMAKYIVDRHKVSSRDDDGTSYVLKQCKKINKDNDPDLYISEEDLDKAFEMRKGDAQLILDYLKEEYHSPTISYRDFEKSMVRAQTNSNALGHTLSDAIKVAEVLNSIMVGLLLVIVFIAWLILTDIVSTKILILVASPLLAATFMFGDTCKKIFEGIIFCFINHPFDVGDLCIIDKTELEVRRMSVLTTTFVVTGTKEKVLYPNAALATIPIINLGGEPDPSDTIEVTLDSNYSKPVFDQLQNEIHKIFEEDGGQIFKQANSAVVKGTGDSLTMEVRFDHVIGTNITTHLQCIEKKRQQKSKLLLQIKHLVDQINNKNLSSTDNNIVVNEK